MSGFGKANGTALSLAGMAAKPAESIYIYIYIYIYMYNVYIQFKQKQNWPKSDLTLLVRLVQVPTCWEDRKSPLVAVPSFGFGGEMHSPVVSIPSFTFLDFVWAVHSDPWDQSGKHAQT